MVPPVVSTDSAVDLSGTLELRLTDRMVQAVQRPTGYDSSALLGSGEPAQDASAGSSRQAHPMVDAQPPERCLTPFRPRSEDELHGVKSASSGGIGSCQSRVSHVKGDLCC